MPIYRIRCARCASMQEVFRRVAAMDDIPECCGERMQRMVCAPMVVADIKPYQAMGTDIATGKAPVINSRSQHRDYLRRNGYVEVGSEMPKQRSTVEGDFNLRGELTQAVREVLPKYTR